MVPRETALRFVAQPYTDEQNASFARQFRSEGFVVLPDVFERESVGQFRCDVLAKAERRGGIIRLPKATPSAGVLTVPADAPELVEPAMAPRLRCFVPQLLAPAHPRLNGKHTAGAQIFELGWKVTRPSDCAAPAAWHRDRAGGAEEPGEHSSPSSDRYRYPEAVHAAMYYCDMDESLAPTELIRRSHLVGVGAEVQATAAIRQYQQGPNAADVDPETPKGQALKVSFTPRAQDVVVWDQRCWHRIGQWAAAHPQATTAKAGPAAAAAAAGATPSTDVRLISIFGWHQCQMFAGTGYAKPYAMPAALAKLWAEAGATDDPDAQDVSAMLGGRWSAASVYRELEMPADGNHEADSGAAAPPSAQDGGA